MKYNTKYTNVRVVSVSLLRAEFFKVANAYSDKIGHARGNQCRPIDGKLLQVNDNYTLANCSYCPIKNNNYFFIVGFALTFY